MRKNRRVERLYQTPEEKRIFEECSKPDYYVKGLTTLKKIDWSGVK